MCGAFVVFFFLRSGTVEGGLFPNFAKLGLGKVCKNPGQVCLPGGE